MNARNGAAGAIDPETGLYSRQGLTECVRQLLETGGHGVLACLVVRLFVDGGDAPRIVHRAAAALSATTRLGDIVARLAHTDFAVVALDSDAAGARRLAERISEAVREVFARSERSRVRLVVGYDMVAGGAGQGPGRDIMPETLLFRAAAAARAGVPDGQGRTIRRYDHGDARDDVAVRRRPLVKSAILSHGTATAAPTPLAPGTRVP
jgi:GGDEF domain-containing protein